MIDIQVLEECVREADSRGYQARQMVFAEAARIYTTRISPVSASTVRRHNRLHLATPVGVRGGDKGVRVVRRRGFRDSARTRRAAAVLGKNVPRKYLGLVDQVARGSRAAADKLKCLECCCWSQSEVRHCEDMGCSLWLFRPYQKKAELPVLN